MIRRFALVGCFALLAGAVFAEPAGRGGPGTSGQQASAQQASASSSQTSGQAQPAPVITKAADGSAAQPAIAPAPFENVDVHTSAKTQFPFMQGPVLRADRYNIKNASMVDLIANAYSLEAEKVVSGPAWLDTDRFDINAKAAAGTSADTLKLMLQAVLADRFKLVTHHDEKPMQVYVLSVGKGKPKFSEAAGTGDPGCVPQQQGQQQQGAPAYITVSCHNMTMDALATTLHQFAGGYLSSPVTNSTGLKGAYDFDFKWSPRGLLPQQGADGISIFDAMEKQLGLHLELAKVSTPVLVVDSVNEKPTPNAPGVESSVPAGPTEFEVAVIKPSNSDEQINVRLDPSGTLTAQAFPLKQMIILAWNLNPNDPEELVNAPKWLDSARFDINAKTSTSGTAVQLDLDDLRKMVQKLLIERFEMKVHMENRDVSAYSLVAVNPKMPKADPMDRTGCKNGPGPDGKDPRIANPILSRLLYCQNITMAQFADQLQLLAGGYIFTPVEDATHLQGAYSFTLSFSPVGAVNGGVHGLGGDGGGAGAGAGGGGGSNSSDPTGAISLFDAMSKQLGLKLEQRKRPLPVLVIDHINEKPDN